LYTVSPKLVWSRSHDLLKLWDISDNISVTVMPSVPWCCWLGGGRASGL